LVYCVKKNLATLLGSRSKKSRFLFGIAAIVVLKTRAGICPAVERSFKIAKFTAAIVNGIHSVRSNQWLL
jgi:hypothetical protein